MNGFNEIEFYNICKKFNAEPKMKEVSVGYDEDTYFNKVKKAVNTDRRGEVVFCVKRPNGKYIAITCEEYPKGVFRIPTGGLGHSEDIVEAVYRETREELGLEVEIVKFAGVVKIRFVHRKEEINFFSYLFILKEKSGRLLEDASDDEVSEVREVDVGGLEEIALSLNRIEGEWSDWGKFRYITTNEIYQILKEEA
ncbi:MAG: NUDIX hydrolase [Clostridia bacterium]|nr:NUDIX hydrolase [Clostridia bacterium]